MSNKLKQIAAILANDDVRDPRATLRAIEQVVVAAESPVATIKVFDNPGSNGPLKATVEIKYSGKRLEPRHMAAVGAAIKDFAEQRAAEECNEPDCPVHGLSPLSELFKQFEEQALKGNAEQPRRRKEDQV